MTDDFDLRALIGNALTRWKEPDPKVIARRLVSRIPQDQRDDVLAACLTHRVREQIRETRGSTHDTAASTVGRSRWAEDRYGGILRERHYTASGWKLLGDCTVDDVVFIASEYGRRKAEQAACERKFTEMAERMRQVDAATVADLYRESEVWAA